MAWKTVPVCDDCWEKENPGRVPVKFREEHRINEICTYCGKENKSGIYIRRDVSK